MLDLNGNIAETDATHIFVVRDGELSTSRVVASPEGISERNTKMLTGCVCRGTASFRSIGHLKYELTKRFADEADDLVSWIPDRIKRHTESRIGIIPKLADSKVRLKIAEKVSDFMKLIGEQMNLNATSFEIVSFALIKIHLEKFAYKVYRDTRTSAHDRGVDLATNFGVVYQVKKLRVESRLDADKLYAELKLNFDTERLQNGNVILVIDDIAEDVRRYLIDMKVQSIKRDQLLTIAEDFREPEDRQKVLRVIYEEFRRDYSSAIK